MFLNMRRSLGIPDWWFPVKKRMTQKFNSIDKVKAIQSKTLIVHGEDDKACPLEHAEALFKQLGAEDKEIKTYTATGHNDIWGDSRALWDIEEFLSVL